MSGRPRAGSPSAPAPARRPPWSPTQGAFFTLQQWFPVVVGVVLALVVHGAKVTARPVANAATLGLGASVLSTVEDATSVGLSLSAILAPLVILAILVVLVAARVLLRWRRTAARGLPGRPRRTT